MSMDLASFASETRGHGVRDLLDGHADTPLPPTVSTERGMSYVDTFIKVFYFPPMDALAWIQDNFLKYRQNHMVALIIGSALAASEDRRSVQTLVNRVQALYTDRKAEIAAV